MKNLLNLSILSIFVILVTTSSCGRKELEKNNLALKSQKDSLQLVADSLGRDLEFWKSDDAEGWSSFYYVTERLDTADRTIDSLNLFTKKLQVKADSLQAKIITMATQKPVGKQKPVTKAIKGQIILSGNMAVIFKSDSAKLASTIPAGYKLQIKPR